MTESELSGIEARSNAATPGPWTAPQDILFIIHAREDIPKLIAEVRRLREWKKKEQWQLEEDKYETEYVVCISGCVAALQSGPKPKHSADCPDFTVDGELK